MQGDSPADETMAVFTKTHDLILWLVPKCERFPRAHRFTVTQRILDAALDVLDQLNEARYRTGRAKLERISHADAALGRLRSLLFIAHRLGWLGDGPYEHVSRLASEVGRLIGGWRRATR